jgi:hypothetical protein
MRVMALPRRTTAKRRLTVKSKLDRFEEKEDMVGGLIGVDSIGWENGQAAGDLATLDVL